MAIDTLRGYVPKLALPLYTRITREHQNDYEVGKKYSMRVDDEQRQQEKGGKGPYNYTHEAILVAKEHMTLDEIPDILLAFEAHTSSRSEAIDWLSPSEGSYDDEEELVVLLFLRLDKAVEWVRSGGQSQLPPFTVEDYEGNG